MKPDTAPLPLCDVAQATIMFYFVPGTFLSYRERPVCRLPLIYLMAWLLLKFVLWSWSFVLHADGASLRVRIAES